MPDPLPQNNLLDELQIWRHNRSVYAGWLIAPEAVRDRLWSHTQNWFPRFLQLQSALNLHQQLEVLFELNWRLETALVPIWNDLVPVYKRVTEAFNPFPQDVTDLPNATIVLTNATTRELDWSAIRQRWLAITLGVLRYYREERHSDAFEELLARLRRIKDIDSDTRARLCYERCLFALGDMNDESAIQALQEWPDKTLDSFWSVRRAAVLAELGLTAQALSAIERALTMLRAGLSDDTGHIPGLSREGWAIWLTMALRRNNQWRGFPGEDAGERAEVRRRFKHLQKYGCSPDEIIDFFEGRLDQPTPQLRPQTETRPGFQPQTSSQTMHSNGDFGKKLLSAYQYMRLIEEAAHPPHFGNVILHKDSIEQVAEWFSEHDPVRTQSIMIRLLDDKLIDRYLTRHRVAALRSESVIRFKTIACRAIEQALPDTPTSFPPNNDEEGRASDRVESAVELLSRVSIRETAEGFSQLWELGRRLYMAPSSRVNPSFDRPLRHFFETLIESSPRELLIQQLPVLFGLPAPGEADFAVRFPGNYPDPPRMAAQPFSSPIWQRPPVAWREVKVRLFNMIRANDISLKRTAFFRLVALKDLGGLSASECQRLAAVFWASASDPPALPIEAWESATPWVALTLPAPRAIDTSDRIRQHILSGQPGEVHVGVVHPWSFFELVLFATKPLEQGRRASTDRHYIPWTVNDIEQLFAIIRNWWENRGRTQ